jgi:hypothetical protein
MPARLRSVVTPSLIISLLALFIATRGASYAALQLPTKSVGTKQLKKSAVTTKKVKNRSLLAKDFKKGQLPRGAQGLPGPAGPSGPTGPRGPRDAYRADRTGPLLALTTTFQPIVTTQVLPAGSYVLFGRANIAAGPSTVICSLENDAAQNVTVAAGGVVALAQTATVVLDTPRAVTVNCLKSAGNPQVAQASITAIRVESLSAS